jgi:D-glycero-D-manno-heptose 1,7-bisphosphate phosphatase
VLDRAYPDAAGVLHPPASVAELEILPGAAEAVALLRARGYLPVIVTNQPDVARGTQTRDVVEELDRRVGAAVGIADIAVCFHDDADHCRCRKPEPGLLLDAARDLDLDLGRSFIVGDSWRDVEAGRRAGCRTVFVGKSLSAPYRAHLYAADVLDAARQIVARGDRSRE